MCFILFHFFWVMLGSGDMSIISILDILCLLDMNIFFHIIHFRESVLDDWPVIKPETLESKIT